MFPLVDPDSINHVVIFMLGTMPFPDGYAAAIYMNWDGLENWQLLGFISNEKPSAIFKIAHSKLAQTAVNPFAGQFLQVGC